MVRGHRSGIWHLVSRGPADGCALASWSTRCGWSFGLSPKAQVDDLSALPHVFSAVCQKCMPARYDELIDELVGTPAPAQQQAEKLMLEASVDQARLRWELCVLAQDNSQMLALALELRPLVYLLGDAVEEDIILKLSPIPL